VLLSCVFASYLQMPTLAALVYHKLCGSTATAPHASMGYAENLLYMLNAQGDPSYRPDQKMVAALEVLLLHAEHEMDCCTAAVRHLASR
jgi:citrate synthase